MSVKSNISTITCPKCGQTLPGWAQGCQFCGNTITQGFVRPVDADRYGVDNRPSWKEVAYIAVSSLFVLQGGFTLLLAFDVIQNDAYKLGGGTFMGMTGSAYAILGLGMLFHQVWAQFVMKWVCVVALFGHGLSVLMAMIELSNPHFGWPILLARSFSFFLDIFTLYILYSEADV